MKLPGPGGRERDLFELLRAQRRRLDRERRCAHRGERGFCGEPGAAFDARRGWRCARHVETLAPETQ